MVLPKAVERAFGTLISSNAKKATVYLDENMAVKVTRRFKPNKREKSEDFVLTVGRPNYAERAFIRACKKAGEPLPVRKVQLKWWPKKRKK